ncbi:cadherin-like protein 26 [Aplochiton taeniatus]
MSSSAANLHSKHIPSEAELAQRAPEIDSTQQLKLRERQRFFEEVFQHDVDVYLSSAHLTIRDYRRPPISSISSMEVNVDMLEQMDLMDNSDQETLDVFLSSGGEEGSLASPLSVSGNNNNNDNVINNGLFRHVLDGFEAKSRISSTSSNCSSNSQNTNEAGGKTPIIQSDDDEVHVNKVLRTATPLEKDGLNRSSISSCSCVIGSEAVSRQKRSWIIGTFTIEEGHAGPFPYKLGKIEIERKYTVNFELHGEGVEEEPKGVLSIDKDSGIVFVHKALDYEVHKILKLRLQAKQGASLDTQLGVEITILDINDNPPMFLWERYEINIGEERAQGSFLLSVFAHDEDQRGTPNSTFHYEIASVTPQPPNAEFYVDTNGAISFKGCLEYESGGKYTVVVLAKDHGEVVSLSSSTVLMINVQDGNNHQPVITGQSGAGKVREGEIGALALRLHVTDRDTKNTPAWKAIYIIQGDDGGHFQIYTDPKTNDGILTVVKPLDFETGVKIELSVSVENEEPYFSCEVKERRSSDLWEVDTTGGDARTQSKLSSRKIIIQVEDTNDPPAFTVPVKDVLLKENTEIGTLVDTFTSVDPDSSYASEFVYKIADDPGGWVTVDPNTGCITTAKILDRESHYVVNNVYAVIVHAATQ